MFGITVRYSDDKYYIWAHSAVMQGDKLPSAASIYEDRSTDRVK